MIHPMLLSRIFARFGDMANTASMSINAGSAVAGMWDIGQGLNHRADI
jgi:hypothetical protein